MTLKTAKFSRCWCGCSCGFEAISRKKMGPRLRVLPPAIDSGKKWPRIGSLPSILTVRFFERFARHTMLAGKRQCQPKFRTPIIDRQQPARAQSTGERPQRLQSILAREPWTPDELHLRFTQPVNNNRADGRRSNRLKFMRLLKCWRCRRDRKSHHKCSHQIVSSHRKHRSSCAPGDFHGLLIITFYE